MKVKRLLMVALAACLGVCTLFAGCDRSNSGAGENGTLKITYYKGGTGSEWLEELAAEFEEATKIKVELTADAKATENAKTLLESNRDLPDLMFILYTNWHEYVQKGWLADMDDLFDGTFSYDVNDIKITSKYDVGNTGVYAESGAKTDLTLKDIMTSDFVDYGKMAPKRGDDEHYYVMPWTSPCTGIVYNVDILESVGYEQPPKTEAQLKDLCQKLVAKGIAPFSWGGQEMGYWSFPVLTWWAQSSGVDTWENFYQFESPEVFNDPGRTNALRLWQDLIVDPDDGSIINSVDKPMGRDHMSAQTQFVAGKAAMTPTGSWIETEVGEFTKPGFRMKMMATPIIEGAKSDEQILNTSAGDFACIPKNAKNVDAAKAFLAYMNRPEWVERFTKITGVPRAFNYKPSTIEGTSEFAQSCFELFENSTLMYRVSNSPLYVYANVSEWPKYGDNVFGNLMTETKVTPEWIVNDMYEYAKKQWSTWEKLS